MGQWERDADAVWPDLAPPLGEQQEQDQQSGVGARQVHHGLGEAQIASALHDAADNPAVDARPLSGPQHECRVEHGQPHRLEHEPVNVDRQRFVLAVGIPWTKQIAGPEQLTRRTFAHCHAADHQPVDHEQTEPAGLGHRGYRARIPIRRPDVYDRCEPHDDAPSRGPPPALPPRGRDRRRGGTRFRERCPDRWPPFTRYPTTSSGQRSPVRDVSRWRDPR